MKNNSNSAKSLALWLFVILVLLIIILGGIILVQKRNGASAGENLSFDQTAANITFTESAVTEAETQTEVSTETFASEPQLEFDDVEIDSYAALLTDLNGNELFAKNESEKIYPASLTKIMTAMVAIENVYDLDEDIMITGDIFDQINAENGSTAGFSAYETLSYRDLLYGAILSSGAECCLTLANYISGSEWNFVEMMNDKARELGMNDTNFTNVCGFHNLDHYSTVSDVSRLLRYALENDTFYEIFTSDSYYVQTDVHPEGITLRSTMFSEMSTPDFVGGRIIGGKTGFTDEAGLCLASAAEVDGKIYTLVTTGAPGTHYTEPLHILDAVNVYEKLSD